MTLQELIENEPKAKHRLTDGGIYNQGYNKIYLSPTTTLDRTNTPLSITIDICHNNLYYRMKYARRWTVTDADKNYRVYILSYIDITKTLYEIIDNESLGKYKYNPNDDTHVFEYDGVVEYIEDEEDVFNLTLLDIGDNIFDVLYLTKYRSLKSLSKW